MFFGDYGFVMKGWVSMNVTVVLHVERFFAVMPRLAGVWLEAALCRLRVEDERSWLGRFTHFC